MGHPARRVMEVPRLSSRTLLALVLCSLLAAPARADEAPGPEGLSPTPSAPAETASTAPEAASPDGIVLEIATPSAEPAELVLELATASAEPGAIVLETASASAEPGEIVLEIATPSIDPGEMVFETATPSTETAEIVLETATPSTAPPEIVLEIATPSTDTGAVVLEPATGSASPVTVASGSPVPVVTATPSADPFAWRRNIPFDLVVDGGVEGLGQGTMSGLGYVERESAIAGIRLPNLERSGTLSAGGSWGNLEARLGPLALGLRGSLLSATTTSDTPYTPAFPERRWDCYARVGALSLGMRQETFGGSGVLSGDYQSVFGGLDGTLLDLFGTVSLDYGLLAGWGTQKPRTVPAAVAHLPGEGHLELAIRLPWCTLRGGLRAVAIVNVDPARAWGLLTDPGSLIPSAANEQIAATSGLSATSWSVYTGPYLRLGATF
jgi:hypothetical protein